MTSPELASLELLAEIDTITGRLQRWADDAPPWQPAENCQALVHRLISRAQTIRVRLESPLVVATLGGTGTGKSALVNALVGADVVAAGRARPTTTQPVLVCRPDLAPEMLGIEPEAVHLVQRDLPTLAELVLVDCPDPDTTEDVQATGTNLARLRPILAHCDVLLVVTTQQKYRSARVADELAAAAPGARLVFVQTHADVEEDIRADWRHVLDQRYSMGEIFLVDSLSALADAQAGLPANGDFARLRDLLTRQLAGTTGNRIRRANFLDLVADTLASAHARADSVLPAVNRLQTAVHEQRVRLSAHLAKQTRDELLVNRRQWEIRLLGRVVSRWGFSPFALVLRMFLGLGALVSRALLFRARTPAQMALWGAMEAARSWRDYRTRRKVDESLVAAGCWDPAELRESAVIVAGYAAEAGIERQGASPETVIAEAARAGTGFAAEVATGLDAVLDRLAVRHTGWFTRWRYEFLLAVMLGLLVYRLGKNFFYDSWWASPPTPVFGLEFYLSAAFWLFLWSLLLYWSFSSRLRRGLRGQVDQLVQGWTDDRPAAGLFARLDDDCRRVARFRQELADLERYVADLRRRLALPDDQLGHRR
jgi:hypothetical protein